MPALRTTRYSHHLRREGIAVHAIAKHAVDGFMQESEGQPVDVGDLILLQMRRVARRSWEPVFAK